MGETYEKKLNVIIMDRCEQCEEKKRLLTEEHKKRREREIERIRAAEKAGETYDTFL